MINAFILEPHIVRGAVNVDGLLSFYLVLRYRRLLWAIVAEEGRFGVGVHDCRALNQRVNPTVELALIVVHHADHLWPDHLGAWRLLFLAALTAVIFGALK